MKEKDWDIEEIRRLYWNEELTAKEVGERLGYSETSILVRMRRHNIPRRTSGPLPASINPDELQDLYENKHMTLHELSKKFNVGPETIRCHLIKHNIARRLQRLTIGPEELHRMYWIEGLTTPEIGKLLDRGDPVIRNYMIKYNIPLRSRMGNNRYKDREVLRNAVLKRDNFTCQAYGCNAKDSLQCHHIVPYKISGDNNIDNMITLCAYHHRLVEWELPWIFIISMCGIDPDTKSILASMVRSWKFDKEEK